MESVHEIAGPLDGPGLAASLLAAHLVYLGAGREQEHESARSVALFFAVTRDSQADATLVLCHGAQGSTRTDAEWWSGREHLASLTVGAA